MANIARRSATISRARSSPWGWQAVRIFGKGQLSNENGSRRVYLGRTRSRLPGRSARREGPDYLSLKLDDPSFNALIDADLSDQLVEDATCSGCGRGRTVCDRLSTGRRSFGRSRVVARPLHPDSVSIPQQTASLALTPVLGLGDRSNEKSSLSSNRAVNFGHVMAYIEETRPLSRLVFSQQKR